MRTSQTDYKQVRGRDLCAAEPLSDVGGTWYTLIPLEHDARLNSTKRRRQGGSVLTGSKRRNRGGGQSPAVPAVGLWWGGSVAQGPWALGSSGVLSGCGVARSQRLRSTVALVAIIMGSLLVASTSVLSAGAASSQATTIAIGDICSCTGAGASSVAQTTPTAQAWASWVNAHGGLNGHPVKLYVDDDQADPGLSTTDIENFIHIDHVAAIFDASNEDSIWIEMTARAGVPVLGGESSPLGYTNTDVFPPGATVNYGIAGEEAGAAKHGIKTQAIMYCVEVNVCASETAIAAKIGARFGVKVTYRVGISFSSPNYTAQCVAAKEAGAQSLDIADATTIAEKVAQECAAQGYKPVQITGSASVALSMATDPNFRGMIATQPNIPWFVHDAATKDFYSALGKYAPTLLTSPDFGEGAIQQWANGALLQDAIASAAPAKGTAVTGAVVKEGLYHLPPGDDLGGLAPESIHFTKGVPANFSCWFYMSANGEKFIWSNRHQPGCAPLMQPGTPEGGPLLKR